MKLLITGVTGFLGRYVCAELSLTDCALHVISRRPLTEHDPYSVIVHDFMDKDDLASKIPYPVDAVVHIAHAMAGSREEQMSFALRSTSQLLDYAFIHGVKTFVLVSSLAVLDLKSIAVHGTVNLHTPRLKQSESLPAYVAAKLAQELLVEEAVAKKGLNVVILRPGLIYDTTVMSSANAGLIKGSLQVAISHDGQIPLVSAQRTAEQIFKAASSLNMSGLNTRLVLDEYPWSMLRYRNALVKRGQMKADVFTMPWWVMNSLGACAEAIADSFSFRERLPALFMQPSRSARLKPLIYWPST